MEALIRNSIEGVLKDVCEFVLVLANDPNAGGIDVAKGYNIPVATIISKGKTRENFEDEVSAMLHDYGVELICLAGFNRIISSYLIGRYAGRIVNIHPADTNEFRGLHGYEWAFCEGKQKTKVTVHFVDEGVDTGAIIEQREVDLSGCATLEEVESRGLAVEHDVYSVAIEKVCKDIMRKTK